MLQSEALGFNKEIIMKKLLLGLILLSGLMGIEFKSHAAGTIGLLGQCGVSYGGCISGLRCFPTSKGHVCGVSQAQLEGLGYING